jgi:hypothetical protein
MRIEATIRGIMTWPGLTPNVQSFCKTFKLYQFSKKTRKQYGKISVKVAVKVAEATPWEIAQVGLIGPRKDKTRSGIKTLRCFTAIYLASSWP